MSVTLWTSTQDENSLNFSNTNFVDIMEFLGFKVLTEHGLCGSFEDDNLHKLYKLAKISLKTLRLTHSEEELNPPGEGIYMAGITEPWYLASRLSALVALCEEAIESGDRISYA